MIGYEARARITADVAGFVAAQRQGAQAAGAFSTSVQALNNQLLRNSSLAAQSATNMRNYSQAAQRTGQQQSQSASSAQTLNQAMQQGAMAYAASSAGAAAAAASINANSQAQTRAAQTTNTNTQAQRQGAQSLQQMGRELGRLIPQQQQFRAALAQGASMTREQAQAAAQVDQRLGSLTQQMIRMNSEQQRTVRQYRDLTMASRLASQATQEQSAAQVRMAQTGRLSETQLRQMGAEVARLTVQRDRLQANQRAGIALTQQETQTLAALQGRLRELAGIYAQLEAAQKQVFTTSRQLAQANQAVASTSQQAATAARQQEAAAEGMNRSLWSLRSAVGDATSSMQQLWSVSSRVTRVLWENYSAQEMAIAQISRVSQATVSELDTIVQQVRVMSTEIPIAFEELGEIAMLGSQVGIANEALGTFTETVGLFAATSEVSADETASMLARIMEMTNLSETHGQEAVRNLGSAIAYLGSNALATDREILKTVESIATMTTQVGFSAEATVGLGSAMASLVIKPEIARGASQRVFLQLGEAIKGTGGEMETLVEVTGMSQDALLELSQNDFEEYFFTVMEALSGVAKEGGDLIPIIREMGIINTRDAEVVARLASNYGILEQSVRESGHAFESGQYLYEESDRIFNTLTARVQIMSNTWNNFLFGAVEAIAPFLTRLVEATTNLIQMADAMGAAPFLGGAALFLGIAGAVGLLISGLGFASQGVLAFMGVVNLLRGTTAGAAAATTTAAVANTTYAGSAALAAAATRGQAAAATIGTVANRGLATSMATAAAASRAFMLANPITAVIGLTAAVIGGYKAWDNYSNSADRSNEKLLASNRVHLDAAGGMQALQDALISDTERWNEAREAAELHMITLNDGRTVYGSAAQDILKYSAFRTESSRDMVAADQDAATAAQELEQAQSEAAFGIVSSSGEAGSATEQLSRRYQDSIHPMLDATGDLNYTQKDLKDSVEDTASSFDGATYAIGTATRDWAAAALNSAMVATEMWESAESLKQLSDAGINFSSALTMELSEVGAGVAYLESGVDAIRANMNWLQRFQSDARIAINGWTGGFIDLRNQTDITITGMHEMIGATGSVSAAIETSDLTKAQSISVLSEMAEELGYTSDELSGMDDAAIEAAASTEILNEAVMGTGLTVGEFAEAMASFIDPLDIWSSGLQEMNDNLDEGDAAFTRFIDNGENNFDRYLAGMYEMREAQLEWSTNLLELSERVPPQIIGDLAAMGQEGAGLVADLVDATDEQVERWVDLWEQGGEQLLTDYAVIWESFRVQAFEGGDSGGLEFVNSLMGQVATGEITMAEAVDEMISYAEENFESADPTIDFYADNTEAINELNSTLTEVRDAIRDMNNSSAVDVKPGLETKTFWDGLVAFWNDTIVWWGSGPNLNVAPRMTSHVPKRKDGGWVQGPGGPRQDKVPLLASPNEFVVNAAAARRNASLLEMINSGGQLPAKRTFMPDVGPERFNRTNPSRVRSMPDYGQTASAGVRRQFDGERIVVNVKNYYPQAEPTSVTTNRALQHVAGLNGVL